MKSLVLYFFLLVLEVSFNFILDVIHKYSRFSETFPEKGLEFVIYGGNGSVMFDLSLMLVPAKVDSIREEQNYKKDAFMTLGSNNFKIVLALLIEVVRFHMGVSKV